MHNPWSLLFSVRRVSLAEYLLVLRVLFPYCCRWPDVLRLLRQLSLPRYGRGLGPWAWSTFITHLLLLWDATNPGTVMEQEVCVCWFQTICFRYLNLNLVCNDLCLNSDLLCICELYVIWNGSAKLLRSWLRCWKSLRSLGISWTTGIMGAWVPRFNHSVVVFGT